MNKKTTLYDQHVSLDGKMVPFAGYLMPLKYHGEVVEHCHTREKVSIFDVSHMGEIEIKGKGALGFCQYVLSNDAKKLTIGKVQYTVIMNELGGAVDDATLYRLDTDHYLLCVNAANQDKDFAFLKKYANDFDCKVINESLNWDLLAIQGPYSINLLQDVIVSHGQHNLPVDLNEMPFFTCQKTKIEDISVILSRTGYTGEKGFEIFVRPESTVQLWDILFKKGAQYDLQPCGLSARDTLRLEMGYMLYGSDLDDGTSPIEAGLGWVVKMEGDFLGSSIIKAHRQGQIRKRLIALKLVDKGIPRHGCPVYNAANDNDPVGIVTSGNYSPSLGIGIALAYIQPNVYAIDKEYWIGIRNNKKRAILQKLPFYKRMEKT